MPNFRHRLTRAQQRIYDRSNAAPSVRFAASTRVREAVRALPAALGEADRGRVEHLAQVIAEEICAAVCVGRVRVIVHGTRPSNVRGELHGLYTASRAGRAAQIEVWMRTAKRGQVVAFKTFLRTVLHELCHHLDYSLLKLGDSFHTDGFYQRESSLFYQIGGALALPQAGGRATGADRSTARLAAAVSNAVHEVA